MSGTPNGLVKRLLGRPAAAFLRRARDRWRILRDAATRPTLTVSTHSFELLRLGSAYGGWTVADTGDLQGSTIISCGLGEDASFDVEFAARFNARVILVDPTPRAVSHFHSISKRLGSPAERAYTQDGNQPPTAYDLREVRPGQLELVERALWTERTTLKFFAPPDPTHVSHSIGNYQHQWRTDTASIQVEATTLESLLDTYGLSELPLLKLDIEGAEVEVVQQMLTKSIRPRQLLLEYDELSVRSRRSKDRIEATHFALLQQGYRLVHSDPPSNFLYVRTKP